MSVSLEPAGEEFDRVARVWAKANHASRNELNQEWSEQRYSPAHCMLWALTWWCWIEKIREGYEIAWTLHAINNQGFLGGGATGRV